MINFIHPAFEELSEKEGLVTNGLGGYAASALPGANTPATYHSLFFQNVLPNGWTDWISPDTARLFAQVGAPALYFSFPKGEFKESSNWFKNFEYAKEKYRGLDYHAVAPTKCWDQRNC